jgi:hypothetical protein
MLVRCPMIIMQNEGKWRGSYTNLDTFNPESQYHGGSIVRVALTLSWALPDRRFYNWSDTPRQSPWASAPQRSGARKCVSRGHEMHLDLGSQAGKAVRTYPNISWRRRRGVSLLRFNRAGRM